MDRWIRTGSSDSGNPSRKRDPSRALGFFILVPGRGLEPPRLAAYAPQAYMFTITPPGRVEILYYNFFSFFFYNWRFCLPGNDRLVALYMEHARIPKLTADRLRRLLTDEVELRAANLGALHNLDRVNERSIEREGFLDADARKSRTNGEHTARFDTML